MTARFIITDGTTTVNLLGPVFRIREWLPAISPYKGGGLYADSPLSDGRRLVDYRFDNGVETFELTANAESQDRVIRWTQNLRRLLEKAAQYWTRKWAGGPVWIEAKASNESNIRYALIISGHMDNDDGPFRQPFLQPLCRSTMNGLTLILERDHWQEARPETGVCMPVSARPDLFEDTYETRLNAVAGTDLVALWKFNELAGLAAYNYSTYDHQMDAVYNAGILLDDLTFLTGEPAALVGLGSGAVNIHTPLLETYWDAFDMGDEGTFMIWIRSSGPIWTSGDEHYILYLASESGDNITIRKTTTDNQIEARFIANGVTRSVATATLAGTTDWTNIAVRWNAATHEIRLYINGIARAVNLDYHGSFIGPLSEAYVGAADNTGTTSLSADIAYAALWKTALLDHDILPVLQPPNVSDGETLCEGAFVANKRNEARLSHVWYFDASTATFSTNLIEHDYDTTALLLPLVPAASDILYLGSSTQTVPAGGVFDSAILDIYTDTLPSGVTGSWQYWNGAWVALNIFDNTGGLLNGGINGVHWIPPTDWASTAINSVTGKFVRFLVSAVVSPVPPRQQNRMPYTAIRPFITIPASSVPGDIPALVGIALRGVSDEGSGANARPIRRVYAGLRSLSRGYGFSANINLADVQNQAGITISVGTNTTFVADNQAPAGRSAVYNPTGAEVIAERANIRIESNLASTFRGTYRAFLRGRTTGTTTWSARLVMKVQTEELDLVTDTKEWIGTSVDIVDLGVITLPPGLSDLLPDELAGGFDIGVEMSASVGTNNFNLYDVILVPIDECTWVAEATSDTTGNLIGYWTTTFYGGAGVTTELLADGVKNRRSGPRGLLSVPGEEIYARWRMISGSTIGCHANELQRWWFLFTDTFASTHDISEPATTMEAAMTRQARYLSARGDR